MISDHVIVPSSLTLVFFLLARHSSLATGLPAVFWAGHFPYSFQSFTNCQFATLLFSSSYELPVPPLLKRKEEIMNPETQMSPSSPVELAIDLAVAPAEHVDTTASPRCQYRYPNGSRCRLRSTQSGHCSRHFLETRLARAVATPLPQTIDDSVDLSADLLPQLHESPTIDIRQFLARLLVQLTKGRVSPRRAWVLTCISSQLLNSNRGNAKRIHSSRTRT